MLIHVIQNNNISEELLSRAKILPGKSLTLNFKSNNIVNDLFKNMKINQNNLDKPVPAYQNNTKKSNHKIEIKSGK